MPNPVTISEIEKRFRPLTTTEAEAVQFMLDDAWSVLLGTVPDLEDRMTSGAVSEPLASFVVSSMVLRVLRNPNGVRSWSVDDYSETRDNAVSAGVLYALPNEVDLLTGRANPKRRGAFSVGAAREPCPAPGAERDAAELEWLRYGWSSGYGYEPGCAPGYGYYVP
jgi:hypothetical protein